VERCRDGFISDPGECGCIPDCDPGEQWCERSNSCIEDPGEPPCAGLNAFWDYDSCQWLYVDPCFPGKMNLDTCECEYCPTNYTYCGAICWPYVLPPCWQELNCVWNYDTCDFDCDTVTCPDGEIYDTDLCLCRPRCVDGQEWCESTQQCVVSVPGPGTCWQLPYTFNKTTCEVEVGDPCPCPPGYTWSEISCRCEEDVASTVIGPCEIEWAWFTYPIYGYCWASPIGFPITTIETYSEDDGFYCPPPDPVEFLGDTYDDFVLCDTYSQGANNICVWSSFGIASASISASYEGQNPPGTRYDSYFRCGDSLIQCGSTVIYPKPQAYQFRPCGSLSHFYNSEWCVDVLMPRTVVSSQNLSYQNWVCCLDYAFDPDWIPACSNDGSSLWDMYRGWCSCNGVSPVEEDDDDSLAGPWIARINNGFAAVSVLRSGDVKFLVGDAHGPPWTTYTVATPTDEEVLGQPRHALSMDHSILLVYSYRVGAVSEIRMQTSQDEGETWTEAETMISNAKSPTIQVDRTTGMAIIAGTRNGIVVAKRKFSGESDWSDEFNFELSDGTPLAIDGSFHLVFGTGVDNEWLLVGRAPNATAITTWRSFDEADTWELVS